MYSARIYTHVYRMVKDREEAEDVTQETFLKAFRALPSYDPNRPFRCWLYAIATNTALNALRAARRSGRSIPLEPGIWGERPESPHGGASDSPVGTAHEYAEQVAAAVRRLPPRAAALVHLHYYEGMRIREAAEMTGISEGAAKVALHRARRSLREWLVDEVDR